MVKKESGFTRHKVDITEEKNLLTNLIISKEYCKEILPQITDTKIFQNPYTPILVKWIREHFDLSQKAPGNYVQKIFEREKKGLGAEKAEMVEAFLENLNEGLSKWENDWTMRATEVDFQPEPEVEAGKKYLRERELLAHAEDIEKLAKIDLDKAEKLAKNYAKSHESPSGLLPKIKSTLIDSENLIKAKIDKPHAVLSPWLTDGSVTMLYGPRGTGKTWLALILGVSLTRSNCVGTKIGPWDIVSPAGVLYIDGEMGDAELQNRILKLTKPLGPPDDECKLTFLFANRFALDHHRQINLTEKEWREAIFKYVEGNDKINLVIIDNVAALTPGLDENVKKDWDPINQWLIELKQLNVSVVFIHHAGKQKQQRGTSAREDMIDCTINLSLPADYKPSMGAYFIVRFEKHRNVPPGANLESFSLRVIETEEGDSLTWTSEIRANEISMEQIAMALLMETTCGQIELGGIIGCSQSIVSKAFTHGKAIGLMGNNRTPTEKGERFIKEMEEQYNYNLNDYLGEE